VHSMQILDSGANPTYRIEAPTTRPNASPASGDDTSFAATLGRALDGVNEKNQEANVAVSQMLDGTGEVHDAMIALHEAEEAIEITVAVRNKLVQAYQEIMRMPL
jgi:flagellar hook-basal body complex protein FliE